MAVPEWLKSLGIQHPLQVKFLAAYSSLGMISRAAAVAKIDRCTHYEWKKTDEKYRAAFAEAEAHVGDLLEDAAFNRAVYGVSKPVFYEGQECGAIQEYSDSLLSQQLKAAKPKKYRENIHQDLSADESLSALFEAMKKKPESDAPKS
jgi:hypothetical protein